MEITERLGHTVVAAESERYLVERLARIIDRSKEELRLVAGDEDVQLPEAVASTLAELVHSIARGDGVVVLPVQSELSPRQAALVLNVSRPYLTRLLDQGEIPFHRVGSHRRVALSDLLAYKERRDASRQEELRRLSELSREIGIPE